MIVLDVNLLLYAVNKDSPNHNLAKGLFEQFLASTETIGMSWQVLLAFLRLTTSKVIFDSPLSLEDSFALIESWLTQPCVAIIHPTDRHAALLKELLTPLGTGGNLTSDAHLAALAIEHGATLVSFDNDFSRFKGLNWKNPTK